MTPRSRSRLIVAFAIVLGVGLVSLLAVAAAEGPTEPAVTLAEPHAGDAWTYDLVLEGDWPTRPDDPIQPGANADAFAFRLESDVVRLADLHVHDATRLTVEGYSYYHWEIADEPNWEATERFAWYGSEDLLATQGRQWAGAAGGSGGMTVPVTEAPVVQQATALEMQVVERTFEPERVPCLGPNEEAGRSIAVGDEVTLWQACTLGGLISIDPTTGPFHAEAIEEADGMAALRLVHDGGVQVWFNPGIPYPVKVTVPASDGHGSAVLTLSGFEPGTAPFRPEHESPREPAPAPIMAPAQPWGPDDAGSGVPFPASEAFLQALADPEMAELHDYMAAHPDAFAMRGWLLVTERTADYMAMQQEDGRSWTWGFVLSDGSADCYGFSVSRDQDQTTIYDSLGTLSGASFAATVEPNSDDCMVSGSDGEPVPPTRPASWPTVASAFDTWEHYDEAPPAAERGWGFSVGDEGEDPVLVAGLPTLVAHETQSPMTYSYSQVGGDAGLVLEGGNVAGFARRDVAFTWSSEVAGQPVPQASALPASTADEGGPSSPIRAAAAITPGVATGISLLSLLAGAAYLLWPTLKGGGLGLFSRVQPDELLEHPQRARIVQAVEASPGVHYQALLRQTGLGNGALEHHLRKLRDAGLVRAIRQGGYTCYFVGAPVPGAAATKSEGARRLLEEVRARPGQGLVEAAASAGVSRATASHHVARLEEAGLVTSLRDGRVRRLWPAGTATAAS